MFDVEYGRWQEEHYRLMYELRAALQQHLPEGELQMYVESCLAHHDEMLGIKDAVIKGDVFHLISVVWRSPAERCFLWLGGFRPSEVIKVSPRGFFFSINVFAAHSSSFHSWIYFLHHSF
jgi:transcription factor TGA